MDIEDIKIKTKRRPLSKGGSNFETHVLFKKNNSELVIKPTLGLALFVAVFTTFSICFTGFPLYKLIHNKTDSWEFNRLLFIAVGLVFFCVSIYLLFNYFSPHGFDKASNRYYRGFKSIKTKMSVDISLKTIVAIQLIGETVSDEDGSFKSFELNIILNNAERLNVMDHSNLRGIINDAETLSEFLNVPIWHAESNKT